MTGARLIFHLYRRVGNLVVLVQIVMNTLQQRIMIVRWNHLHVQR